MTDSRLRAVLAILLGTTIIVVDGLDLQILGYAVPAIKADLQSPERHIGIALAATFVGSIFGRLVLGPVADYLGRKIVVLWCLGVFGLLTALIGFAQSFFEITLLRFFAGIALGGAYPAVFAYVAERVADSWRAFAISVVSVGTPIGGVGAGLLAQVTLEPLGWRYLFGISGLMVLTVFLITRFFMTEPARARQADSGPWCDALLGIGRALATRVVELFRQGRSRITLTLWLVYLFSQMVTGYLMGWLPILVNVNGATGTSGTAALAIFNTGAVAGALTLGLLGRWVPATLIAFVCFSCGTVLILVVAAMIGADAGALYSLLLVTGVCTMGGVLIVNTITAASYPHDLRATGIGWAFAWSNIGLAIGVFLGGIASEADFTVQRQFVYAGGSLLITAVLLASLLRR